MPSYKVGCVDDPNARIIRVVHISDTHGGHKDMTIPRGDILIHSGDFITWNQSQGFDRDTAKLDKFFERQPHRVKIFVAGNHEVSFIGHSAEEIQARLPHVTYLQDTSITVDGLLIHGSPQTPQRTSSASAFTTPYEELQEKHWSLIPRETKLLVTHCPPGDIENFSGKLACERLQEIVEEIQPLVHMFGHVHRAAEAVQEGKTLFSNGTQGSEFLGISEPVIIDVYVPAEQDVADVVNDQTAELSCLKNTSVIGLFNGVHSKF